MSMEKIEKYATVAAAASVGFGYLAPGNNMLINGMKVNVYLVGAGIGLLSSVASDSLHKLIFPGVSVHSVTDTAGSAMLAPATTGLGFIAVPKLLNGGVFNDVSMGKVFLVGAASEMLGIWTYENIVLPMTNGNDQPVYN